MHSTTDLILLLLAATTTGAFFGPALLLASWLARHSAPKFWGRVTSRARTRVSRFIFLLGLVSGIAYLLLDPNGKLIALEELTGFFVIMLLSAFALTWRSRKDETNKSLA